MAGKARYINFQYAPDFIKKLKRLDVRIRKSFKQAMVIFLKNPEDPQLDNHELKRNWSGHRSIDVNADYRAIYREIEENGETVAYFVAIGKHEELYK